MFLARRDTMFARQLFLALGLVLISMTPQIALAQGSGDLCLADDHYLDDRKPGSLDGVLGSSRLAVEERLRELDPTQILFTEYLAPNCGGVYVDYYENQVAYSISTYSPREDEFKSLWEPDDADWTKEEGMEIVLSLLPADAVDRETLKDDEDEFMVVGSSETLLSQVPAEVYDCVYMFTGRDPVYGAYCYTLGFNELGGVTFVSAEFLVRVVPNDAISG
jgi:hypothetical protein